MTRRTHDWTEVATAIHLIQFAAEQAAEAGFERNTDDLLVALSNAEAAIRKAKRNLRRALKGTTL